MRLSLRIALALAALVALVLVGLGAASLRREVRLIEHDVQSDAILVASSLAGLLEGVPREAWTASDVSDLLRVPGSDGTVTVRWLDRDALVAFAPADAARVEGATVWTAPGRDGDLVHAVAPVHRGEVLVGAVHVAESLHARDAYVARATRTDAVAVSSVVALSGVLALVLGRWLVGRRVEALIRKAREVGRGELRHPVDVGGADELTTLADELNEMALDLDRARKAAVAEAEARVAAEVQLRHADRLRSVGQLAAGLAHELGTPLNVVAGRAALVERRAADEATRRDAGTIREQTRRISELVRRMLDFSRRPEAARRPCDLDQVAAEVVALLGSTAHRAGVDLRHEPAPAPVRTLADPAQLQQVLANLVLNAIQARGTEVVVGARPCTCEQLPGPHLRLSVADRGPGLAPEILPQLFDPFFTTKPPGEGTGLGLPIAQAIVVEHGGALLAENRADGPGAAFSAHLPLEVPPEAP